MPIMTVKVAAAVAVLLHIGLVGCAEPPFVGEPDQARTSPAVSSPAVSSRDVEGPGARGYFTDPSEYFDDAAHAALADVQMEIYLPRWLPEWTQAADVVVFPLLTDGYQASWMLPFGETELTRQLGSEVVLTVSGNPRQVGGDTPTDWIERASAEGLGIFLLSPRNDDCPQRSGADEEMTAMLQWMPHGDDTYYLVDLSPRPACTADVLDHESIVEVAESLVRID